MKSLRLCKKFGLFLCLALWLGALLPQGYMPDFAAMQDGIFKISICSPDGPINVPHTGKTSKPPCLFAGWTQASTLTITPPVIGAPLFAAEQPLLAPSPILLAAQFRPAAARAPPIA